MTDTTAITTQEPGRVPDLGKPPTFLERMMPKDFGELITFSGIVAKAGWAPVSYRKDVPRNQAGARVGRPEDQDFDAEKILIGIMQGAEVGLKPLQALQSIAVINGIPSVYGDAMLAIVNASGLLDDFSEVQILKGEEVIGWTVTAHRKGRATPTARTFTVDDARKANLLEKAGPWKQYRTRMLQMRARALCLRDAFPDVLKGLQAVEEAQDVQVVSNTPLPLPAPKSVGGKLDAFAGTAAPQEPEDAQIEEVVDSATGEVSEFPAIPDEVKTAMGAGSYGALIVWMDEQLQVVGDRQGLVDHYANHLKAARAANAKMAANVAKLLVAFGVTILEETEE